MFQTASGVIIPFPEKIREAFEFTNHGIRFNLSFEKLRPMVDEFLEGLQEPLFVVLQIPLSREEENKLRKSDSDPFHEKVGYLDGQSKEQVKDILYKYGELLLNDGMSQFGIASHNTHEEMFIQRYKIVDIFSRNKKAYVKFVKKYGLMQTDHLLTVWDTFTRETPGDNFSITINGITVYDVYDELVKLGMYDANIVEI